MTAEQDIRLRAIVAVLLEEVSAITSVAEAASQRPETAHLVDPLSDVAGGIIAQTENIMAILKEDVA